MTMVACETLRAQSIRHQAGRIWNEDMDVNLEDNWFVVYRSRSMV